MQIILRRLLSAVVLGAAGFLGVAPSHAATYGDEKWCAVTDDGASAMNWDCEYESPTDCAPAVLQGNRGFCAINPYYQAPQPYPAPQR
jgi:hypothetical protein